MACFNAWDIGACGCAVPVVTCQGCPSSAGNLPLAGQAIQVWDHSGGTLLTTLTADGSGNISLSAGTYWLIPAGGRFNGQNVTISGNRAVNFASASGYTCINTASGCPIPIANTLHLTDSQYGAYTLTFASNGCYDGTAGWSGSLAISGPTCCGAGDTLTSSNLCSNGKFTGGSIALLDSLINATCSPFSYSHTFSIPAVCANNAYYMYCATSVSFTITE
jgi:hypothetical protein